VVSWGKFYIIFSCQQYLVVVVVVVVVWESNAKCVFVLIFD
jgi:hypothetical protein